MQRFERRPEPEFLAQNAARWNNQWANLKTRNPGALFQWYKHNGQPVNQLLLPDLSAQTQQHCSYCDAFPPRLNDETIDHFQPKSDPFFYNNAYSWINLYLSCGHCQNAKMEQYSADLLRPDVEGFSFERYFFYNFTSHEIEANLDASAEEQRRAIVTRDTFQFNHPGQTTSRRHAWERWVNLSEHERFLEDFPFRFMLL
jgi:uncharacterized protein (TIGR02646 family)